MFGSTLTSRIYWVEFVFSTNVSYYKQIIEFLTIFILSFFDEQKNMKINYLLF
jgi:hypothetical protein